MACLVLQAARPQEGLPSKRANTAVLSPFDAPPPAGHPAKAAAPPAGKPDLAGRPSRADSAGPTGKDSDPVAVLASRAQEPQPAAPRRPAQPLPIRRDVPQVWCCSPACCLVMHWRDRSSHLCAHAPEPAMLCTSAVLCRLGTHSLRCLQVQDGLLPGSPMDIDTSPLIGASSAAGPVRSANLAAGTAINIELLHKIITGRHDSHLRDCQFCRTCTCWVVQARQAVHPSCSCTWQCSATLLTRCLSAYTCGCRAHTAQTSWLSGSCCHRRCPSIRTRAGCEGSHASAPAGSCAAPGTPAEPAGPACSAG